MSTAPLELSELGANVADRPMAAHAWPRPLPPGAHQERDHGERHMPDEHDRSRIDVGRADRQMIEQAAAQLRKGAILAGYSGLEHKEFAFALALILDELALNAAGLPDNLRTSY